jgi:hypothetical protein
MDRNAARVSPARRDGVEGGGTQRQRISTAGETLFGPAEATPSGREAYKGETQKRSNPIVIDPHTPGQTRFGPPATPQ